MSWHQTKSYSVGGKTYQVTRHEEWNNDETQVEFYIASITKAERVYVESNEDIYEDATFPTLLEVKSALADAKKYALSPREQLEVDVLAAKRGLEQRQMTAKNAAHRATLAEAAVATAVQTAEKHAVAARAHATAAAQQLADAEVRYADLQVQLQTLKN